MALQISYRQDIWAKPLVIGVRDCGTQIYQSCQVSERHFCHISISNYLCTRIKLTCYNNLISCSLFRQSFLETLIANKNEDDDNNLAGAVYRYSSLMTFLAPKWSSLSLVTFKGSVSGPSKSLDFVQRDHLESLKWPHLLIFSR